MIRLAIHLLLVVIIGCSGSPAGQNYSWVMDQEGLFTPTEIVQLSALARDHEQRTSYEIMIVTTPTIEPHERMLYYAVEIGNKAGVGKKDKDNGVVIVVSRALGEAFIATGYGTEKVLPDEQVKLIVDSVMVPHFREERYFAGTYAGTEAVIEWLEGR